MVANAFRRVNDSFARTVWLIDVDNGRVLTAADAAAGFDLCLHMVRSAGEQAQAIEFASRHGCDRLH